MRPPDVELGMAIFAFKGAPENFLAVPLASAKPEPTSLAESGSSSEVRSPTDSWLGHSIGG